MSSNKDMGVPYFYTISIQGRQAEIGVAPRTAWESGIVHIVPGHTSKKIFEFLLGRVAAKYSIADPLLIAFWLGPNDFEIS